MIQILFIHIIHYLKQGIESYKYFNLLFVVVRCCLLLFVVVCCCLLFVVCCRLIYQYLHRRRARVSPHPTADR